MSLVSAKPVRDHVLKLRAAGGTYASISQAAQTGAMTVHRIATARRPNEADLSSSAIVRLLASGTREELLVVLREIFERNVLAERLAYSPDEAADLLGISRELVHDLLRTGQLGSVKAGPAG